MEIEEFIKQNKKYCQQKIIGESEGGRPIYALNLRKGIWQGKKAMLVSCLHGSEERTVSDNLRTLETILSHDMLKTWEITSVPVANPDGKECGMRYNSNWTDLNRDFFAKKAKETRAIIKAYKEFRPEIVLGYHTTKDSYDSCIILPSKSTETGMFKNIMFSYSLTKKRAYLTQLPYLTASIEGKITKIATYIDDGIYKMDEEVGGLEDYAIKESKIAVAIENGDPDFAVYFSTQLLKKYTRK